MKRELLAEDGARVCMLTDDLVRARGHKRGWTEVRFRQAARKGGEHHLEVDGAVVEREQASWVEQGQMLVEIAQQMRATGSAVEGWRRVVEGSSFVQLRLAGLVLLVRSALGGDTAADAVLQELSAVGTGRAAIELWRALEEVRDDAEREALHDRVLHEPAAWEIVAPIAAGWIGAHWRTRDWARSVRKRLRSDRSEPRVGALDIAKNGTGGGLSDDAAGGGVSAPED